LASSALERTGHGLLSNESRLTTGMMKMVVWYVWQASVGVFGYGKVDIQVIVEQKHAGIDAESTCPARRSCGS
jgi:hypothetical protein